MFKVKPIDTQAALDKASMDQTNPAAKPEPDKTNVQLPDEKKSFDALLQEVQATTAMPDDTQDVLPDKPRVDPAPATSMLNEIERSTAQTLSKDPNATHQQSLLNDSAVSGRPQPALSGTELRRARTSAAKHVHQQNPGGQLDRTRIASLASAISIHCWPKRAARIGDGNPNAGRPAVSI